MLVTLALLVASGAVQPQRDIPAIDPVSKETRCPETPMSMARKLGGRPPRAIPLNQLPPAQTFMAVDRQIDRCPAPLTMTQYRRGARR